MVATGTTTQKTIDKREPTLLERAILVDWYQETLKRFLGHQEAVDAFISEIFNQARKAPKLYQCTIESTRFTIARVASLRLNPAIPNEVALIPRSLKQPDGKYAKEMTVIYGYGGLRKLAMRSPEVNDVLTAAVCVNDRFVPPPNVISLPIHVMPEGFKPRGRVIGYYAAAQLTNGNWRTWPMSVAEVETHAKRYVDNIETAPSWNKGVRPDVEDGLTPFDKMGLKTCLRMLLNGRDIPLSTEISQALEDEAVSLHVETPGERQGYDRDGKRPALTMGTGQTIEDLLGDLGGDHAGVQSTLAREREYVRVTVDEKAEEKAMVAPETQEGTQSILEASGGQKQGTEDSTLARSMAEEYLAQHVVEDTLWRQILRANINFVPFGDLLDECMQALRDVRFNHTRGNELAGIAADLGGGDGPK